MPASWCRVWMPAPPTERPHRRIQRRAPLLPFAPGSMFCAEGSCRTRPRNTSVCVSSQPWHQQPLVPVLWISAPRSVLLFLCHFGAGGVSAELFGRLTALGSEPQRNCAHSWSDCTHYTLKTSSRAISCGEIPQWNNYLRYHLFSPNSV